MRVKVVDWNVNGFATTGQPDLLGSLEWDIACLQEVTEASWPLFRSLADHGDVASTTSHPWPEPRPGVESTEQSGVRPGDRVAPDVGAVIG